MIDPRAIEKLRVASFGWFRGDLARGPQKPHPPPPSLRSAYGKMLMSGLPSLVITGANEHQAREKDTPSSPFKGTSSLKRATMNKHDDVAVTCSSQETRASASAAAAGSLLVFLVVAYIIS